MPACRAHYGWGCFPGLAPSPRDGGPVTYRCTEDARHDGPHVLLVAGERVERPRTIGRPRRVGEPPTVTLSYRVPRARRAELDAAIRRLLAR